MDGKLAIVRSIYIHVVNFLLFFSTHAGWIQCCYKNAENIFYFLLLLADCRKISRAIVFCFQRRCKKNVRPIYIRAPGIVGHVTHEMAWRQQSMSYICKGKKPTRPKYRNCNTEEKAAAYVLGQNTEEDPVSQKHHPTQTPAYFKQAAVLRLLSIQGEKNIHWKPFDDPLPLQFSKPNVWTD